MYWPLYQTILLLSAAACALLWTRRPVRPAFGYAGAAGWIIVTLQARNITAYSNGTSIAVESEAFQYLSAAMTLLTIATVVLYYLGVYPPVVDSEAEAAEIQPTEDTTNA